MRANSDLAFLYFSSSTVKDIMLLQDVAFLLWKESWELAKNPMASKGTHLHGPRIKLIEKAHNLFAETKEHMYEAKAAEEHARLLRWSFCWRHGFVNTSTNWVIV